MAESRLRRRQTISCQVIQRWTHEDEQSHTQPLVSFTEEDSELSWSSEEERVEQKGQKLDREFSVKSKKSKSRRKHKQLGAEPEPASLLNGG